MTVQTYEQRILIPEENKWLYNDSAKVISDKVYLGKDADASEWVEITQEEKEALEKEWEEETEEQIATITSKNRTSAVSI